ncbi:m-AAA protease-interacting protein 1, mitochondrial [Cynoglossus semilaevis]|uniref:Matrix AAA peptidase interacting protein 1 n=1 Tax=Cynoglossus semilaevis TaxID=244447 RepID=A0A3P8WAJ3_CYNSE|nr:m-AAA protease-interacting protein 1, mitochondrial [Cynoglossus semilaevis]
MALPALRGCYRVPFTYGFSRLFRHEHLLTKGFGKQWLPPPEPTCVTAAVHRHYSSDQGREKQVKKVVVVGIPNPLTWFRTRIYYFLIRTYFDTEFSIEEFTEGAKQAFSHVSRLLSECRFDALEGLVAKDLIEKLEEKCNLLSLSYKNALSAEPDDIMYTTTGDVGIYYDNDGRKFVSILMRFWYLTSAQLPDDTMERDQLFKVPLVGDTQGDTKRLLVAKYEFQREFTKGVAPDWTITRIEHSKLLE